MNKLDFTKIIDLCQNYSRNFPNLRKKKEKMANGDLSKLKEEIANLKIYLLIQLNTNMDREKDRNTEPLFIYYP